MSTFSEQSLSSFSVAVGAGPTQELVTSITTLEAAVSGVPDLTDGQAVLNVAETTSLILLPSGYYISAATTGASFLECPSANVWQITGVGSPVTLQTPTGANGLVLQQSGGRMAGFGGTPVVRPTVSGAKGSNAALASLMTALGPSGLNLVADSTSA